MKTAIVVCGNSGIDYLPHSEEILKFRCSVQFGADEIYEDFVELDNKTFYERIAKDPNTIPKTSYTPIGEMIERFDELYEKGYEEVIVITISSKLSNMNEAVAALDGQVRIKVHAFDSKVAGYAEAFMALVAYRMSKEGKNSKEILPTLFKIRENMKVYFTVDTLLYLVKNGRLSKFSGVLGNFLKIKPILTVNNEGSVVTLEKQRTKKRAFKRLIQLYVEETKQYKNVISYILHANNEENANDLIGEIQSLYPDRKFEVVPLTPVVGAHAGPKAIAIGYILSDEKID